MQSLIALARRYWATIRRPSVHYSLGFLVIGGFVAGVVFWGAFNTALELTNTETFCTGCHEMRDNVYVELQRTIHYTNRSGVRAKCPDCHVPHEWTHKIARKMQASKSAPWQLRHSSESFAFMRAHSCCASSSRWSTNFSRVSMVPKSLPQTSLDACILRAILCVHSCGTWQSGHLARTPLRLV